MVRSEESDRGHHVGLRGARRLRDHRTVRLWQVDVDPLPESHARDDSEGEGRREGPPQRGGHLHAARGDRPSPDRNGVPESQSVSDDVHLRKRRGGPSAERRTQPGPARYGGPGEPEAGRPLGRGEGLVGEERGELVRRPTTAALHREGPRGASGGPPDGRALCGPRSHRDREDRGPHLRPEEGLYGRDRDAQHATSRTRGGDDGLHVSGPPHRGRRDARALRKAKRDIDRKLHHGEVWVVPQAAERKALQKGLLKLNENMVTLAELSELAIRKAIDALTRLDAEAVRNIMQVDDDVDRMHDENFNELVRRMTEGSLKIETGARYILVNRYLERIADHAVNIGMRVVYMVTGDWLPRERAADRAKRIPK